MSQTGVAVSDYLLNLALDQVTICYMYAIFKPKSHSRFNINFLPLLTHSMTMRVYTVQVHSPSEFSYRQYRV